MLGYRDSDVHIILLLFAAIEPVVLLTMDIEIKSSERGGERGREREREKEREKEKEKERKRERNTTKIEPTQS